MKFMNIDKSRIHGLLIDLDNTLYPAELAYEEALKVCGVDKALYDSARNQVKDRLPKRHTSSHHRMLYFQEMMTESQKYTPGAVLELNDIYERALMNCVATFWKGSGYFSLLKSLKARFRICLITNETLRTQLIKLTVIDPQAEIFDCLAISEQVGYEKPDHRLFNFALDQLNLKACEVCAIGDSIKDDIFPAIELGMQAILTTEFSKKIIVPTNIVTIQCFSELGILLQNDSI